MHGHLGGVNSRHEAILEREITHSRPIMRKGILVNCKLLNKKETIDGT